MQALKKQESVDILFLTEAGGRDMNPVLVRNIRLGDGTPKICVPIAEKKIEDIVKQAKLIIDSPADMVEWRADWFEDVFDFDKTREVLKALREILGEIPILFTIRTIVEGGEIKVDAETYVELNKKAIDTMLVDLIDVEVLHFDADAKEIINYAHKKAVKVIASHHDFEKTPEEEILIMKLQTMEEFDADVMKVAVMPKVPEDVELLLAIAKDRAYPFVAIAMSKLGIKSRLQGAITFGTVGKASAPGQISVYELKKMLV